MSEYLCQYTNDLTSLDEIKREKKYEKRDREAEGERNRVFITHFASHVTWFYNWKPYALFFCCIEYGLLEIYQIKQTSIHKRTYSTIYSLAARFSTDCSALHSYKTV